VKPAVFQFLVAGALAVAWIWMLGRPLLTMLARRSRRDSVGHFRHQQAVLGRSIGVDVPVRSPWLRALRPVAEWRSQPVERRRLQLLLGFAIASFVAALLAIALRGVFVRLFLVMAIGLVVHLLVGAWIGARELRAGEADQIRRALLADERPAESGGRPVARNDTGPAIDELGDGLFDEAFFEPIPEFERLRSPGPPIPDDPPAPQEGTGSPPVEPAAATGVIPDLPGDQEDAPVTEPVADQTGPEPTFTTPRRERHRPPRRPKARPIYIESELDDGDGTIRAVND
jgi:hypothetical protein